MDPEYGLPSLPDKSVDLCITDIPFNIGINSSKKIMGRWDNINKETVKYFDNRRDFDVFMGVVFLQLERVCLGIIIYCGETNLGMFCRIKNPKQIIYRYSPNSFSNGRISYRRTIFPLVCYGKFKNRINNDFFNYYSNSGFLSERKFIHPCPLNEDFWSDLLNQLKPKSVIDPFLGSGTTAEVCTKLGIKWLGYEINEIYSQDINKRLKNCVKEPTQQALEAFL